MYAEGCQGLLGQTPEDSCSKQPPACLAATVTACPRMTTWQAATAREVWCVQEAEAAEKAEEAARAAKKAAFKASLDKQVKEAAARKMQQPMSPVERCINKDLLDKIQTYQRTGLV